MRASTYSFKRAPPPPPLPFVNGSVQLRSLRDERLRALINVWNPAVTRAQLDDTKPDGSLDWRTSRVAAAETQAAGVSLGKNTVEVLRKLSSNVVSVSFASLYVLPVCLHGWRLVQPAFTSGQMKEKLQPLMKNRGRHFQHQQVFGTD